MIVLSHMTASDADSHQQWFEAASNNWFGAASAHTRLLPRRLLEERQALMAAFAALFFGNLVAAKEWHLKMRVR